MWISVSVYATGAVWNVRILRSIDPALDRIVVAAIRNTPWMPALKGRGAVDSTIIFPITFRIGPLNVLTSSQHAPR